jgi:hypothetical protein
MEISPKIYQWHIPIPHTWIEWWTFKCDHVLNWFLLPKLGLLWLIWIFNDKNHLKINISPILSPQLTKHIPSNLAPQDLSNNTKGTSQFLWNFQIMIYFNIQSKNHSIIQEPLHHKSKHDETKLMHPSLSKIFPKIPIKWSETPPVWWISWLHYKTEQTTFLHR